MKARKPSPNASEEVQRPDSWFPRSFSLFGSDTVPVPASVAISRKELFRAKAIQREFSYVQFIAATLLQVLVDCQFVLAVQFPAGLCQRSQDASWVSVANDGGVGVSDVLEKSDFP